MTCSTIDIIPHVTAPGTKSVYAVLPPKVIWLTLCPVAELIWTSIHPGE